MLHLGTFLNRYFRKFPRKQISRQTKDVYSSILSEILQKIYLSVLVGTRFEHFYDLKVPRSFRSLLLVFHEVRIYFFFFFFFFVLLRMLK